MLKITLSFTLLLVFQSCGFFENDKIEYQIQIIDKIKIQKQENNKSVNLVFEETDEAFAVIVDNCLNVYYDSANKKIYVKSYLTKTINEYYQITVINSSSKNVSDAIKKVEVSNNSFNNQIKGCIVIFPRSADF